MDFETQQRLLLSRDWRCACGRVIRGTVGGPVCPTCGGPVEVCECPLTEERRLIVVLEDIEGSIRSLPKLSG